MPTRRLRQLASNPAIWLMVIVGLALIAGVELLPLQARARTIQPAVPELLPDLAIDGMGIHDVANDTCFANPAELRLLVYVSNRGEVDAGSFVVSVTEQRQTVTGLVAGAQARVLFDPGYGGQTTAVVDVDNQVPESDESNNATTMYVPVPTALPYCALDQQMFLPVIR